MRIKNLLATVVLMVAAITPVVAQGFQMPPIPVDKAVRMGKLPNGLTYYVRQNGYPEKRVNFYIAQRVGSIQEEESQRGLAHFLEHMAFNGSDNFKGNNLIEYLRGLGVEFGSDLNAYTSVDETVYRICNVPSTRQSALDSCLLILKDWSNGLTLDAKEIDKERGVIHEEWRLRTSAMNRMLERNLEALYPGSKYGKRFPIGKMEVIDNFKPKELRDYYHKWYHPENQAIIVVGDIDVDYTEQKIKELFSGIKKHKNAASVVDEQVPDNAEPIILIDKDKEQQFNILMVNYKHETIPDSAKGDLSYLIQRYATDVMTDMVNSRLAELTQNADCPFIQAMVSDAQYIYAKTKDALSLTIVPKEGKTEEALAATVREIRRAAEFGFTATEYARAKADYLSRLEKVYTNRNKRENNIYGDMLRDHYLANEPIPSIEDEFALMSQIVPNIPVEALSMAMGELVSKNDSNVVILSINNEKEGAVYPTVEGLKKTFSGVSAETLTAYVDNVKDEPLIKELPAKGSIVSEKENTKLGYKELMLSNGVKVVMKKTDFKDDEVLITATSRGGQSLLGEKDLINGKLFSTIIEASGLGNFSNTELQKALAGKQVSVNMNLSNLRESISGRTTPKDMETFMQLTYLYFTDIKKDEKSFASTMNMLSTTLKNKGLSPESAFQDSLQATLYCHNPRFASLEMSDLEKVDYDRILEIAKERTANAADFTFYIVGNYDEAGLRALIEQYIASLPATSEKENWRNVTTYNVGNTTNKFLRKMETPKANSYIYWYNTKAPFTLENSIYADAAGQVLSMIYLKKIREDAGAAYSAGAAGFAQLGGDVPFTTLVGVCPMKPDFADVALKIMEDEVVALGETVDADMLGKVRELMLKQADDNAKKNSHWLTYISNFDEYGVDTMTDYKQIVSAMTPEKVAQFVKNVILGGGNSVKVVMLPEEQAK